jgi:hypothetical protein
MDKVLFLKGDLFFDFLVGNLGFPRRDDELIFDIVISFQYGYNDPVEFR